MTHHPLRRTGTALLAAASLFVGGVLGTASAGAAPTPTPADLDGLPTPVQTVTPTPADVDGLPTRVPTPTPTTTPTPILDAWGCIARTTVVASWPGGFVASVSVRNVSSFMSVETWTVSLSLPQGEVAHSWNATPVDGAPGTFTPAPWSPRVGTTGVAEFGFQGSGSPEGISASCTPR